MSLLVFGAAATIAPLLAGLVPLVKKNALSPNTIHILLALSAGLLLGIATLDLVPEALLLGAGGAHGAPHNHFGGRRLLAVNAVSVQPESVDDSPLSNDHTDHPHESGINLGLLGIGVGFFMLYGLEIFMRTQGVVHSHNLDGNSSFRGHSHSPSSIRTEEHHSHLGWIALAGVAAHSFADGMIISGAFGASSEIGIHVAIAIILHKIPDGFVAMSLMAGNEDGWQQRSIIAVSIVSAVTFVGILVGYMILELMPMEFIGCLLGVGAGTFLFIAAAGILPELAESSPNHVKNYVASLIGYFSVLLFQQTI